MAPKLSIRYCMECSDRTEHWGGKCHPCLKKKKAAPINNQEWVKLSIEEKLDYLYKRIG